MKKNIFNKNSDILKILTRYICRRQGKLVPTERNKAHKTGTFRIHLSGLYEPLF